MFWVWCSAAQQSEQQALNPFNSAVPNPNLRLRGSGMYFEGILFGVFKTIHRETCVKRKPLSFNAVFLVASLSKRQKKSYFSFLPGGLDVVWWVEGCAFPLDKNHGFKSKSKPPTPWVSLF